MEEQLGVFCVVPGIKTRIWEEGTRKRVSASGVQLDYCSVRSAPKSHGDLQGSASVLRILWYFPAQSGDCQAALTTETSLPRGPPSSLSSHAAAIAPCPREASVLRALGSGGRVS